LRRCAGGLWLQGHTERASLLCSVGKNFTMCITYQLIVVSNWYATDLDWYTNDIIKMRTTLALLLICKLIIPHTAWRLPPFSNMADAHLFEINLNICYFNFFHFLIYRLNMADACHFKIFKIFNMAPTSAIFQYGKERGNLN